MSQLTSIEQCKVGMSVWHPFWGKGIIDEVNKINAIVRLDKTNWFRTFTDDEFSKQTRLGADCVISHLFTEPVYICTRHEYKTENEHGMQFNVTEYKPVNQEQ